MRSHPCNGSRPTLYERLIDGRNRQHRAGPAILERGLKKPDLVVVVVGVGHLIGPGGLPALLRAKGYRVDDP